MTSGLASPFAASVPETGAMQIDAVMPEFDATRVEHRIVDGSIAQVYRAVREADFVKAPLENRVVGFLFALRTATERLVTRLRGRTFSEYEEPASMGLADMPSRGEWILLGEDPPREIAFGVIGRFWGGETKLRESDYSEFAGFAEPGFARIACNFSLRPYDEGCTLVSYEARTRGTDPQARRAFLRYWRFVSPMVGLVMRAGPSVVVDDADRRPA